MYPTSLVTIPGFVAGGTIIPGQFVKLTTSDMTVVAAGANDPIFAIAYNATRYPPGTVGSNDDVAATSGQQVNLYAPNQLVPVRCAGVIARGAFVESDTNGSAVTVTTTAAGRRYIGGWAVTLGAASQIIYIWFQPGVTTYPA